MKNHTIITVVILSFILLNSFAAQADLIAHWKFDEPNGPIAYDSAQSNDGTIHNATRVPGKINGALYFDGYYDYVTVPDNEILDVTTAVTLAGWINPSSFQGNGIHNGNPLIAKWQTQNIGQYHFTAYSDGNLAFRIADGSNSELLDVTSGLGTNNWYHVIAWYNGYSMRIYVDGNLIDSKDTDIRQLYQDEYYEDILHLAYDIGGNDPGWHYHGIMDDVRIYNHALNEDEIAALIPEPGTVLLLGLGGLTLLGGRKRK